MRIHLSTKNIKRAVLALCISVMALEPIQVMALDTIYYSGNNILFTDPNACKNVGGNGSKSLVGNKNAEQIWNFLVGNDGNLDAEDALTAEQAAGVMGNLRQESGPNFEPDAKEGNGIGYGIAQWSYGRRTQLENAAKKKGVAVSNLLFQLQYLVEEAKSRQAIRGGGNEWEVLKKQKTIEDALVFWHDSFERSADSAQKVIEVRGGFAQEAFGLKDKFPPKSGGGTTTGGTSGGAKPVVFLDPGHGGAIAAYTDQKSGLRTAESPNSPEREDALEVAKQVKAELERVGYTVILARSGNEDKVTFRERADAAAAAKAAIAVSIHTTPGEINEAWPQRVNKYREYNGKRDTFGDTQDEKDTAKKSEAFADIFARTRTAAEGHSVDTDKDQSTQTGAFTRGGIESKGNISLVQLWSPTVPWIYNEIAQNKGTGITDDRKAAYATGIINAIKEAVPATGAKGECDAVVVSGDLSVMTLKYAWPEYHAAPYANNKPEYQDAMVKAKSEGQYVGGGTNGQIGVDCGAFVTRLLIDSGFEPNYNHSGKVSDNAGPTGTQEAWAQKNWSKVGTGSSIDTAELQPGDVAFSPGHTFVYVGTIPGFDSKIASASFSTTGESWRSPMAGKESLTRGDVTWYRKK